MSKRARLLILLLSCTLFAQDRHPITGRRYAGVMGTAGADWLVRPERETEEQPDRALDLIGIEKGSGTPNTAKVGKISRKQLEEIAKTKTPDLTAADLEAAVRTVAGTARSMGVDVEGL